MSKNILTGKKKNANKKTAENELLKAALDYAGKDWPVFPLHSVRGGECTCGNGNCQNAGKHPRTAHGFKDATTDPGTIKTWWAGWPDANVGIATGHASGIVVLDIDPRNGGDASLAEIEQQNGKLPETLRARTGGGGWHIFFEHPGSHVKSRTIMPGVDIKGDGGYVVAPPSAHLSGKKYTWEEE